MKPSFLTLSAGNSRTSLAAFRQGRLVEALVRAGGEPVDSAVDLLLDRLGRACRPRLALGVSVRPQAWEHMEAALALRGVRLQRVGPGGVSPGIQVCYRPPESAGLDRLVAARAAFALYGPCVVVDAGTAVTVDVAGPGPAFLGGAIAPGGALMGRALGEHCTLLPAGVLPEPPAGLPPTSTAEAMSTGLALGFAGLVDRLVESLLPFAGPGAPCVATGGEAPLWRALSRLPSIHEPLLIHHGLALVAGDLMA